MTDNEKKLDDNDKEYLLEKIRDDIDEDDYYFKITRDMAYRQSDFI